MREALAFLTPLGRPLSPSPKALKWFPLIGLALGACLGGIWWASTRAWNAGVAAVLVVSFDLALTGMLHLDGLADSADGLLPHLERQRRLQVMSEPGVGAFGVSVVAVVLLARWIALASLAPSALLLAGLWCVSRTSMAVAAALVPYARPEGGLATSFIPLRRASQLPSWLLAAGGGAIALAVLLAWRLGAGAPVLVCAIAGAGGVLLLAWRRLGGFTGDVLGAAGVMAETLGLVVAAAKW